MVVREGYREKSQIDKISRDASSYIQLLQDTQGQLSFESESSVGPFCTARLPRGWAAVTIKYGESFTYVVSRSFLTTYPDLLVFDHHDDQLHQ